MFFQEARPRQLHPCKLLAMCTATLPRWVENVFSGRELILNKGTEMKAILTALGTASLLALTACGGGGSGSEANNAAAAAAAEDVTLPADENLALPADTLGNQANALETTNSTDANLGADANLTGNAAGDAGTVSGNAIGNATGNTQ